MDWLTKTAADQGRAIAAGTLDPVDLTQAYLDVAAANPDASRIYARMTPDRALAEAGAARTRAQQGFRVSPLDGVPISWKDLFDTAGIVTEAGSALLEGRTPQTDADVIGKATSLGLICLGKTHMSELAFSGLGLNPITATPPCVNDPDGISGGSSSGAAASVAFGLAAAAIGSDTGGSVRIPAAWNDLVGLKTTTGRLPLTGVVPLCRQFDTIGPLTRSVEDATLLLAAMEAAHPMDLRGASLSGTRFLVLETVVFDGIEDTPAQAFEESVARLEVAGATITRGALPDVADALALTPLLYAPEAYGEWQGVIEANPDKMFAEILERFRSGAKVSAPDYIQGWHQLERLRKSYYAETAGYDAVIMPACPILPPHTERLLSDHEYYVDRNLLALRNTRVGNLMGSASLTLPTGVPSCGLMFVTPPLSEERLLRLGSAAEAALG